MENKIFIQNQVEKVLRGDYTDFLDPYEFKQVINILNKMNINYNTLFLFKDSEKNIIYKDIFPNITLLECKTNEVLKHKEILGTMFKHNISISKYGDIIIDDNKYYIPVLNSIKPYILNINYIFDKLVTFIETDLKCIKDYEYQFDEIEILVSSLRIDSIVSTLTKESRSQIDNLFNNKYVFVNYIPVTKKTYIINDDDIIGIRKNGKYKYIGISKITQKGKYIIKLYKYK